MQGRLPMWRIMVTTPFLCAPLMLMAPLGLVLLPEMDLLRLSRLRLIMQGRLPMWRIMVTTPFLFAPSMLMAPLGLVLLPEMDLMRPQGLRFFSLAKFKPTRARRGWAAHDPRSPQASNATNSVRNK